MNLKLYLEDKHNNEIQSITWPRNPFGLGNWAEDNVGDDRSSLHHVCNAWQYEKASQCDRPLFQQVVEHYWHKIQALDNNTCFWFTPPQIKEWISPKKHLFPSSVTDKLASSLEQAGLQIGIPMWCFEDSRIIDLGQSNWENPSAIASYKSWFLELVQFAELLQNPENIFRCEN